MIGMPEWSPEDQEASYLEGWDVFERDDGRLAIQRLDCPADASESLPFDPIFASDAAAIQFVSARAASGSDRHMRALASNGLKIWSPWPRVLYRAVVELYFDVDNEGDACDATAEMLRPHIRALGADDSCLIDWRYSRRENYPETVSASDLEYS